MADRKGKPAAPLKTLTKKEQEELKKKVQGVCDVTFRYDGECFFECLAEIKPY